MTDNGQSQYEQALSSSQLDFRLIIKLSCYNILTNEDLAAREREFLTEKLDKVQMKAIDKYMKENGLQFKTA